MTDPEVFIVDDNPTNLNLLREILRGRAYRVRVATNGRRALASVRSAPPDLILLDITMPDMNGYDVCRELKADETTEHIPIIFISALDEAADKVRGFASGGADYVTKPFQAEEVLARVEHHLKLSRLQRDLTSRNAELVVANEDLERQRGDLVEINRRLAESEQRALEASRAKSRFLAAMSHDLRTPLTAILGFAELMDRDRTRPADDRDQLDVVRRSSEHLLALIEDVLAASTSEATRLALVEHPFETHRVFDGLAETLRQRVRAKGLRLTFEISDSLPQYARGDERRLRQVLLNLLAHAIEHTESGDVTLSVAWREGIGSFAVRDSGGGLAPDEVERLYEPFPTAIDGHGPGLAVSRNLVHLFGGELAVSTTIGKGTQFSFDARLAPVSPEDARRLLPRTVVGLAPDQPPVRILVADDAPESAALLARLLTLVGFEVREVANGIQAISVWSEWRPHLIWMDLTMPILDGYEATQSIRSEERGVSHCTIVGLSATAQEGDRDAALAAGCDDFLTKPWREATIFLTIAEHLGVRYVYEEPV